MANEFIARKGIISSGSVAVTGSVSVLNSVTASFFKGDGSQLTNLPGSAIGLNIDTYEFTGNGSQTTFDIVESYNINSLFVSVDGLTLNSVDDYTLTANNLEFVSAPPSESIILVRVFVNATTGATGSFSGSFLGNISNAVSSSYAETASVALNGVTGGIINYIPVFTGANTIATSSIFQSSSRNVIVGGSQSFYPGTPPLLEINAGVTNNTELSHFNIDVDNQAEVVIKNYSSGLTASALIKVAGDTETNYVTLGVNSSNYSNVGAVVDGASDAFLVATGSNLFIGNISLDRSLILFNGPSGDALDNARVFISAGGSVGINTNEITAGNQDSLFVRGLPGSINILTGKALIDSYVQLNIKNESTGISASADIVATADNGTEIVNYIDMGINSSNFDGFIGGPNDAYLYSTGRMLHIGNTTPDEHLMFFAGGSDMVADAKLILEPNNRHKLSGSLNVSGSITASFSGSLLGTATSASYVLPSGLPSGVVSASSQVDHDATTNFVANEHIDHSTVSISAGTGLSGGGNLTATRTLSLDTGSVNFVSGSIINVLNPKNVFSSSAQVSYTGLSNIPSGIVSQSSQVSYTGLSNIPSGIVSSSSQINTGSFSGSITSASFATSASYAFPTFIDNLVTVGLAGSNTNYTSIKTAVDSITDASANNTYTVRVYPGVYIEDTITLKSYIAIKGDSSTSTIVSASNPSASIFVMADQTMVIDMQIQGSTAPSASAIVYSSATTPQTNAIAYAENIRFGTNFTNAKVIGSGSSGNCILQCSNVKYGGFTSGSKSFDVGFYVTSGSSGGIGRMQLRNVTSTNGGIAGTDDEQIFALADAPGCTVIVNGCLLTRATGTARGTGFKVYNGGQLRLTGVNFQRWIRGIWAPQTGSAPSIDAIALNFENCTTDVLIEHTGSLGKVQGTDNFLKTQIALDAPLYEVGQDPRKISVAKKGGDFSSISASVAYITDAAVNNRYVIEVGPGQYTENMIDLTGKPYVSIVGSNIQTTQIFPSQSNHPIIKMGVNNEISFLTLANAGAGQAAIYVDDVGDFSQAHKISIYDSDIGIYVNAKTTDTQFYGEYIDINGTFSYGAVLSSSNGATAQCNLENYYLFPSGCAAIGNYAVGPSSSLSLYTAKFQGDATAGSTAIKLEKGTQLEGAGIDIQDADYGIVIPAGGDGPNFRLVGAMIHNSTTYDFDIQNANTRGRYQGVSDHTKINNNSQDFYWNFLDDTDGENDVTRKLSVTFADGTHTDATTLIFKGSPMGVMQGGTITTGSGFNITAASGFGYLQDTIDTDVYKRLDWINGNLTLTANSNNYIYITDAGTLTSAGSIPDNQTNIILGRVVTNNTTVEFIDQTLYNGEHMANKLSTFNREALGPVYSAGSVITEDATPFKLDATAGVYFFSENKFTPSGTSSINLTQYYPSASTWARYTSSVVPNNQYASSSALTAMSSAYYTKHTVYLVGDGVDEKYFLVLNSNQYATLVEAENATLPSIPSYFNDGVVALAAVYVQSGSANITQIQDIRPTIGFRAAGVNASSVHGNLLGLGADDHPQYLLVNGTRAMTSDLSLGTNDITNVGTMFGTASWAITASYALTTAASSGVTSITAGNGLAGGEITSTGTISLDTGSGHFVSGSRKTISSANTTGASGINLTYNNATGIISGALVNSAITVNGQSISLGGSGTVTANTTNTLTLGNGLTGTSFNGNSAVTTTVDTGSVHFVSGSIVNVLNPKAVVSSSGQISHNSTTGYVANEHINHTSVSITAGNGLSGGGDISTTRTITLDTGSVHFLDGVKKELNTEGVFSSSAQVSYTGLSSIPSGIVSSSTQIPALLPNGTVSSSTQVVYTSLSSIPAGIVSTSAQIVSGIAGQNIAPTILSASIVSASQLTGSLKQLFVGTTAPASPAINDLWVDTN